MKKIHHMPSRRYSEAVVYNGLIFLSGQVPETNNQSAYEQTQDVLRQIDDRLAELGSNKSNILDATIFLAYISDYDEMNQAWDTWVVPQSLPARATVEAKLAKPEWRVEIKIIAAC
ncbi:MAG: RidA family protein [Neisseriaceae bacterium]|nr:RidA family protein [Neisseriaceae bacterium]